MTWSATSDAGSIHRGVGGGGGPAGADRLIDWRLTLTPGLPPAARTVDVRFGIGADVVAATVDLAGGPPVRRPALVEVDDDAARDADPDCMSCGPPLPPSPPLPPVEQLPVAPGLELDWSMPVPPAPEPRPSSGLVRPDGGGRARGTVGRRPGRRSGRRLGWAAVDDRGRHHDGAATGAGSDGWLVHRDLSFAPALAPTPAP
jgi:hypothetical protein